MFECLHSALNNDFRLLRAGAFQNDHELIAAESGHRIGIAHQTQQTLASLLQQVIADLVAKAIVDRLEVIQIKHQQTQTLTMASHPRGGTAQAIFQQLAIGQAGQRIVEGHRRQFGRQLYRLQGSDQHLGHQPQSEFEVLGPVDTAPDRIESDEAPQATGGHQRCQHDRLNALALKLAAFGDRFGRQLVHPRHVNRAPLMELLHQPGKGLDRNILQVGRLPADPRRHPFVGIAHGGAVRRVTEQIGAIDAEELTGLPQRPFDAAAKSVAIGTHQGGRYANDRALEFQSAFQRALGAHAGG